MSDPLSDALPSDRSLSHVVIKLPYPSTDPRAALTGCSTGWSAAADAHLIALVEADLASLPPPPSPTLAPPSSPLEWRAGIWVRVSRSLANWAAAFATESGSSNTGVPPEIGDPSKGPVIVQVRLSALYHKAWTQRQQQDRGGLIHSSNPTITPPVSSLPQPPKNGSGRVSAPPANSSSTNKPNNPSSNLAAKVQPAVPLTPSKLRSSSTSAAPSTRVRPVAIISDEKAQKLMSKSSPPSTMTAQAVAAAKASANPLADQALPADAQEAWNRFLARHNAITVDPASPSLSPDSTPIHSSSAVHSRLAAAAAAAAGRGGGATTGVESSVSSRPDGTGTRQSVPNTQQEERQQVQGHMHLNPTARRSSSDSVPGSGTVTPNTAAVQAVRSQLADLTASSYGAFVVASSSSSTSRPTKSASAEMEAHDLPGEAGAGVPLNVDDVSSSSSGSSDSPDASIIPEASPEALFSSTGSITQSGLASAFLEMGEEESTYRLQDSQQQQL